MRTWTNDGRLVTRRMYERRLDEMFGGSRGSRVLQYARCVGLISSGQHGAWCDRPLAPMERAALILMAALCAATNLTLAEATALVTAHADWRRQVMAAAATGADVTLHHTVGRALAVAVRLDSAVIRDPVLGVGGAMAEAA